jgi:glycine/D-amino acid oxidase-like deaminating enzyme
MSAASVREEGKEHYDVLIQGAGIAGLTLAIALKQRGYTVKLVERSAGLAEVGADDLRKFSERTAYDEVPSAVLKKK